MRFRQRWHHTGMMVVAVVALVVIGAKVKVVDHSVTDQTSILRFIEDNRDLGGLSDQSFDEQAGSLLNLFTFGTAHRAPPLWLDPATGQGLPGSVAHMER